MDKTGLKKKIAGACIKIQQRTIENLQAELSEVKRTAEEISCPVDRVDGGYQAQLLAKAEMFGKQLQKARQILDILNRVPVDEKSEKVDFGAVVITGKQKMFVSVSMGKIDIDGETYYAISPNVPVYNAMKGKRAGETFVFNGNRFRIVDIF